MTLTEIELLLSGHAPKRVRQNDMTIRPLAGVIFVCCLLSSCANTTHIVRRDARGEALRVDGAVYVAIPRDGVYGDETYAGSGLMISQAVLGAVVRYARRADIASGIERYDDAHRTARETGYRYVIFPTILHWEDRATEWSARPDKIEVKFEVFDLSRDVVVDSVIITGESGLGTLGGDHPQDLLPRPVGQFVAGLYSNSSTKSKCDLSATEEWKSADSAEKKRLLEACRAHPAQE